MKNIKQNKNLLEQINIQKKIIEDLNYKIALLEEENNILKSQEKEKEKEKDKCVEICDKCGKIFLFISAKECCKDVII